MESIFITEYAFHRVQSGFKKADCTIKVQKSGDSCTFIVQFFPDNGSRHSAVCQYEYIYRTKTEAIIGGGGTECSF